MRVVSPHAGCQQKGRAIESQHPKEMARDVGIAQNVQLMKTPVPDIVLAPSRASPGIRAGQK